MPKFGPGSLILGPEGSDFDISCDVNSFTIEVSKDEGDSKTMLCGTQKPGSVTYTYSGTGNIDIDSQDPEGFFAFTQANAGAQVAFVYVPNTPTETSASGILVVDPLDFGGEEFGEDMNSDVEWTIVGPPSYTYPTPETPAALTNPFARTVYQGTAKGGGNVKVSEETTLRLEKLRQKYSGSSSTTTKSSAPAPAEAK